jgi:tripartite-type tricarboxylate transporter receptor subunit TctC
MKHRWSFAACLAAGMLALGTGQAQTGNYPSKPVRIVIPFTPGSSPDVIMRIVAPKLTEQMGQQFIIENRTGASGIVGTRAVATAEPDGYTLLYTIYSVITANPHLYSNLPYDSVKSFAPVSLMVTLGYIVMASNKSGLKDFKELLATAKAQPGKLNFASAGQGAGNHVSMEMLKQMVKLDIVHIPSRDSAVSIASGETDVALVPYSTGVPLVRGGRARALAVTLDRRLGTLPDVPPIADFVPGYYADVWHGMLAPAGTPPAIVERLSAETAKALKLEDVRKRLAEIGVEPVGSTPKDLADKIQADLEKWGRVIRTANIKLD